MRKLATLRLLGHLRRVAHRGLRDVVRGESEQKGRLWRAPQRVGEREKAHRELEIVARLGAARGSQESVAAAERELRNEGCVLAPRGGAAQRNEGAVRTAKLDLALRDHQLPALERRVDRERLTRGRQRLRQLPPCPKVARLHRKQLGAPRKKRDAAWHDAVRFALHELGVERVQLDVARKGDDAARGERDRL